MKILSKKNSPLIIEKLNTIHNNSIDVLENTGIWFESQKAKEIFKKHGFKIDGDIVYFKEEAVENALKTVPSEFIVKARNSDNDITINLDNFAFAPSGGSPYILDFNGNLRTAKSKDYKNSLKLTQVMDGIDYNYSLVHSDGDIKSENVLLYQLIESIKLTDKPLNCSVDEGSDVLSILFGDSKKKMQENSVKGITYAIGNINPLSPLGISRNESDRLIELCQHGVALAISPLNMAGMTAPCTIPGLLISQNCENLGALVLSQLVNPGCPILYGCISTITNMKDISAPIGTPESRIIEKASAQIAKYYNLPTRGDVGLTDSNLADFQAGSESAFHFLNAVNSGLNLLPGLGALGSWNVGSLEKLVLDEELANYCKRLVKPLEFTKDNIAVELIKKNGHKGTFINEKHTFDNFKSEFYEPKIFTRKFISDNKQNIKNVYEKANQKVKELLDSYEQPKLEKSVLDDLTKYAKLYYK